MFIFLLSTITLLSATTLNYEVGKLYSYDFHSSSRLEATNVEGETRIQLNSFSCSAHFQCIFAGRGKFLFQMTADNIRIAQDIEGTYQVLADGQSDLEESFQRPILFSISDNGEVSNVRASSDDSEEILTIKTAIIHTLRTHTGSTEQSSDKLEIDTQGMHVNHYEQINTGDETEVTSFFNEDDFVYFRDDRADDHDLSLIGDQSTHISDGLIKDALHSTYVSFSQPSDPDTDTSIMNNVLVTSEGSSVLTLNDISVSNAALISANSVEEAIDTAFNGLRTVSFMDSDFYIHRKKKEKAPIDQAIVRKDCPAGVDLCQSYGLSFWVGNKSCGLELSGSVLAGTNKGCKQQTRNLMAGAYASLDLWVLNSKLNLVDAYAEYGYVNGSPQRNAVEVSVFSKSIYRKNFPDLPCFEKSIKVANISQAFTAQYTVYVSILPVTFSVGVQLGFEANVPYKICLTTWDASVSFVPVAKIGLLADVSSSILLARGGIRLTATFTEKVDPTAYISIGQCRVGIKATSYTSPFAARFVGHVQVRDCSEGCAWGEDKEYLFWSWTAPTITKKLFDYYYQV